MGCDMSIPTHGERAEFQIYTYINKIGKLCQQSSIKHLPFWIAERKFKNYLYGIQSVTKNQKELPPTIYHDFLCAVADIGIEYPETAIALSYIIREVSNDVRFRCFPQHYKLDEYEKNSEASIKVIQRNLRGLRDDEIMQDDQNIALNRNRTESCSPWKTNRIRRLSSASQSVRSDVLSFTRDADYGFYDIGVYDSNSYDILDAVIEQRGQIFELNVA
mmetsp:Transcript_9912/g.10017  ORF Transcript_9912/g.10017 Transcript_9912/m.10017 type:complete len:218 (+) Transcript_9912:76-729(+)